MSGVDDETTRPDAATGAAGETGAAPVDALRTTSHRGQEEEMTRAEDVFRADDPPDRTSPPLASAAGSSSAPQMATPTVAGGAEPASALVDPAAASVPSPSRLPPAAVEAPSPDVAPVEAESAMPGRHRGGFERWPTAPVGITPVVTAPDLDAPVLWAPIEPAAPARGMAAWALGFAIVALVVAMFVGWGFPIGLVAIVTAIVALRRPLESRAMAVWALVLGVVSVLYSAGWLVFAATRTDLLALFV